MISELEAVRPGQKADSRQTLQERLQQFASMSRQRRNMPVIRRESTEPSAPATDHEYDYQSAWIARVLATAQPKRHVDISSNPARTASAMPMSIESFTTGQAASDTTRTIDPANLPFRNASLESVSCSGIVESLGFGATGPMDPEADLDAMMELKRVLAPDGSLLFICPIGKPRVIYDLHRVYSFGQVLDAFDGLDLEEFSLIPDGRSATGLLINPDEQITNQQIHGYGCFWLRKPL
jgi:hypothetical protein